VGGSLIWDVTVSCITESYLKASSRESGAAAELAVSNTVLKYAGLSSQSEFIPIAVEYSDPINRDVLQFLGELGRRLVETTGLHFTSGKNPQSNDCPPGMQRQLDGTVGLGLLHIVSPQVRC